MADTTKNITSEVIINNALKKSEEKYRNLHMSMMDGYVFVNMQGQISDSNEAYQRMVGYTAAELATLTYKDLTPVNWHEFEQKIVIEQIMPKRHSPVYQKEYIKKDGTVFPVELRTFLFINDSGETEGMWAIVRDITERKQAEEHIRKSEEKFRRIVESSPTAMYFYHLDHNNRLILTGANPASDLIIGISHRELLGKTIEEAFPNLGYTDVPDLYRRVAKNELGSQSFEIAYEDERFSGYYYVCVFRTGPDEIAVDFLDITRRRQVEEALRRSDIEYRDTLDALPDWIYVVDKQFKIVMVNAAVRNELVCQNLNPDCIGEEIKTGFPFIGNNSLDDIRLVFSKGSPSTGTEKFVWHGRLLHTEITRIPILKDQSVEKVIIMVRDRSKEKEIEEFKQRSTEQKEVLLREIHHRVKNNLAIVISLLNFQLQNNTSKELSRIIMDIQMRIRSMALIHEHLYRSENLDRIPLADYIESLAYKIMTAFTGQQVKLDLDLVPMDVGIETALPVGLIINELLTNAFKYAFPDDTTGNIRVIVKVGQNQMCLLTIQDDGVGLPESSTLDSEKSLGLYIVRLLVEQLGGTINIDRQNGTSFSVRFRNVLPQKP